MRFAKNVGIIDANVRMFLAVPSLVMAVGGAMAYHAYVWAAAWLAVAGVTFALGFFRVSPAYTLLGVSSEGGFHRVRPARLPRRA